MFEKILHPGEKIEFQEECAYCGNGAMAAVNNGYVILTGNRLIVCKKKASMLSIILSIIIFAVLYLGIALTTGLLLGALPGALLGAVSFGAGTMMSKLFSNGKEKATEHAEVSFDRTNIASIEDGSRGVRKMFVIKTRNGDICKIGTKDKAKWIAALKQ